MSTKKGHGIKSMYRGMFIGTSMELLLFAYAALAGAVLGSVYDIIRAFRISLKHNSIAVAVEDCIFVILSFLVYFSFCVELLEGANRLFVAVGMILGFAVYLFSIGRLISKMLSKAFGAAVIICTALVKVFKKVFSYLCGVTDLRRFFKKNKKNIASSDSDGV